MTANYCLRIDQETKQQSEALFKGLGMNLSTAINVFLRQSLRIGGFPFAVRSDVPNAETLAALEESEKLLADPATVRYSVADALKELKK